MKIKRDVKIRALLLLLSCLLICSTGCHGNNKGQGGGKHDIVDTAVAAGDFSTLVTALKAADLVGTLKGKGPFTVFAPNDHAFAKLPSGTLESLLKPENKEKLTSILTYHVLPDEVTAAEVVKLSHAKTVNGQFVTINASHGVVMVNNSEVIKTDIECSNGVIHVIDTVLLPK